jgi:hypothetical protein
MITTSQYFFEKEKNEERSEGTANQSMEVA